MRMVWVGSSLRAPFGKEGTAERFSLVLRRIGDPPYTYEDGAGAFPRSCLIAKLRPFPKKRIIQATTHLTIGIVS